MAKRMNIEEKRKASMAEKTFFLLNPEMLHSRRSGFVFLEILQGQKVSV